MVFMNTNVTRGAGSFVVTSTGMATEVGHISQHAPEHGGRGHAADAPAEEADEPDPRHRRCAPSALSVVLNLSRGESFDTVFTAAIAFAISAIPTGLPAVVTTILSYGTQHAREGERDHEAAPLDRDARLDVGDQLRQDRHADAEPDDGGRADDPGPPLHDLRRRLLDRGDDQARLRPARGAARAVPAADGALRRRGREGRRAGRRPDRGRARRARREGRARRGRDAAGLPARRRAAVRRRLQADGDVPPDARRERPRGRPLPREGRARPAARAGRVPARARGPGDRCPSTTSSSSATWTRTSASRARACA